MQAGATAPPPSAARARVLAAYLQRRWLEEPEPGPGQESEEGADPAAAARAQALAAHRRLREIDTEPFKFGSGMRLDANSDYRFSNFYATAVPVAYQGLEYPTSEHAFQASRFPEAERARFAVGGDLGGWEGLRLFHGAGAPAKQQYWGKKQMLGIVAKLTIRHHRAAGLPAPVNHPDDLAVFAEILRAKYAANPELAAALLQTGGRYLMEFARGAARSRGPPERWGGVAEERESGGWLLRGENEMGFCHMQLRAELAAAEQAARTS